MMTKRTKAVGILGVVSLFAAVSVFAALLYGLSEKKNAIEERARAWVEAEGRRTQLASLAGLVVETEEDRDRLSELVLTDENVIDFLADIEQIARDIGLSIETQSLNVEPQSGSEQFESLALVIELGGSYDAIANMASLVETLPYQVFVKTVSINRNGLDQLGRERWRGTIDIRVTKYK